jgi:23S rRNA (pseudouridine1915-N3)-methyltransferase
MRVIVAAVGRAKAGRDGAAPEAVLFENYARRASFDVTLAEVEERRQLPPAQRMAREGELLLSRVPAQATVVALDRLGKALSSEELAARLGRWRDSGVADVAFLIGGADGLDRAVLDRADLILSFGPMVWPHLLARAMLAEQLWRASAILSGHPYHRGGAPQPGR